MKIQVPGCNKCNQDTSHTLRPSRNEDLRWRLTWIHKATYSSNNKATDRNKSHIVSLPLLFSFDRRQRIDEDDIHSLIGYQECPKNSILSCSSFWHKSKNSLQEWNQTTTTLGEPSQTEGNSRELFKILLLRNKHEYMLFESEAHFVLGITSM